MSTEIPTVYWYFIDLHLSDFRHVTDILKRLNFPISHRACKRFPDSLGTYRLLTATLNPSSQTWTALALGELAQVTVVTDLEQVIQGTDGYCVSSLADVLSGDLETKVRQQLRWFYFF